MSLLTGALLFFVVTLAIGHWIRKNQKKEVYDYFVKMFGYGVAALNLGSAAMIMQASELALSDRISAAFLSSVVGLVILTLIKINSKKS